MRQERRFYKTVLNIALPVTLQSLLSSSFSVVDQIMTGQLGSTSIAGIGLGGKFSSIFSVLLSAIATVAGIMIAQYMGKRSDREVSRSFWLNLCMTFGLAVIFMAMCVGMPMQIMRLYTEDEATRKIAAEYLSILAISYIPMAAGSLVSTLLRCMEAAMLPLYSSVFGAVVNTGLNYVLIFGKLGFPRMGVKGAALASVISQVVSCLLTLSLFLWHYQRQEIRMEVVLGLSRNGRKQYIGILFPILACEFLWSFGENVYTAIYGHMGTSACAAMTLTIPIQVLMIGALSGVSQAAGVIIGKALGSKEYDRAYCESKKLMLYGLGGSVILSIGLMAVGKYYVGIYQVEQAVRITACQILVAFALISPVKVQNMILGGGIIRSGGKTNYVMWIDMIGTWIFGVPLGLLAAFVWKLSIPYVYFVLSLEECVRFGISVWVFRRRKWMNSLE